MSLYKTYKSGEEEFDKKYIVKWEDIDDEVYYRFNVDDFKKDIDPYDIKQFRKQEYISIIKGEIERWNDKLVKCEVLKTSKFVNEGEDYYRGKIAILNDIISHLQSELLLIEKDK